METHFHMKGFALSLALKQRLKATQKWPILLRNDIFAILKDTTLKLVHFTNEVLFPEVSMQFRYLPTTKTKNTLITKNWEILRSNGLLFARVSINTERTLGTRL